MLAFLRIFALSIIMTAAVLATILIFRPTHIAAEPLPATTMDKMLAILRDMPAPMECREDGQVICCFGRDNDIRCCNQNKVGECLSLQRRVNNHFTTVAPSLQSPGGPAPGNTAR